MIAFRISEDHPRSSSRTRPALWRQSHHESVKITTIPGDDERADINRAGRKRLILPTEPARNHPTMIRAQGRSGGPTRSSEIADEQQCGSRRRTRRLGVKLAT
jgi:hypothetical protein